MRQTEITRLGVSGVKEAVAGDEPAESLRFFSLQVWVGKAAAKCTMARKPRDGA